MSQTVISEDEAERAGSAPRSQRRLGAADRLTVILFVLIPTILVVGLVWIPAIGSVVLSFANWSGLGGFDTIQWVGTRNYEDIVSIYPLFWSAV